MLDCSECAAVERIPGKVSRTWLFKGTRVPVKALFQNLEGRGRGRVPRMVPGSGVSLDAFVHIDARSQKSYAADE